MSVKQASLWGAGTQCSLLWLALGLQLLTSQSPQPAVGNRSRSGAARTHVGRLGLRRQIGGYLRVGHGVLTTLCDRRWAGARAHLLQRAPAMPQVIANQVCGLPSISRRVLADATYLNAADADVP
jgi:hypothetical protein